MEAATLASLAVDGDEQQDMSAPEAQSSAPEPKRPGFQYSLTTLLLLFVVLASSLAVFGAWGIVVFALTVGLAIYVHQGWPLAYVVLIVLFLVCLGVLMPTVQGAREAARRAQCCNNLMQISLALLSYEGTNGCFPPATIADKNGKPMHSWRVLILPYLEQNRVYNAYNFNEPWDGPNNKKLLGSRSPIYACPSDPNANAPGATQTNYVVVVGPNAAWPDQKSGKHRLDDFRGESSLTIMVVEVANSGIQWTEPRDLSLDTLGLAGAKSSALTVSSYHHPLDDFFFIYDRCGVNVAMADGHIEYLPPGRLSTNNLRKILQIGGYRGEENGSGVTSFDEGRRLNWPNIAALAVWLLSVGVLLYRAVRGRKARQDLSLVVTSNRT
jgi:prepilin-type processing-associated H-X9-DG protein